jgi:hypothetical protein
VSVAARAGFAASERAVEPAAAELPLDEIAALVDALLDAHGAWIPPLDPSRVRATALPSRDANLVNRA